MMMQLLLKWNGHQLKLEQGELSDMFLAIASDAADERSLEVWIHDHLTTNE